MKKFEELNYFEVLEVPFSASSFEIREAYQEALSVYGEESLSTYSFFSEDERERVLERIEEAYSTLIDERKRGDYEKSLLSEGKISPSALRERSQKKPMAIFQTGHSAGRDAFAARIANKAKASDYDHARKEILSKQYISGNELRGLRESIGIRLEEVFEITRINVSTLKSIEEDEFEKLPTMIYLKSFLKSYAQILQLDPQKVVAAYMENMNSTANGGN